MRVKELANQIDKSIAISDYLAQELDISIPYLPISISCPLHKDEKPSMRLYKPKERGAYCFSCGRAYTTSFIHAKLNPHLNFTQALRDLMKKFNIQILETEHLEKNKNFSNVFNAQCAKITTNYLKQFDNTKPNHIRAKFTQLENALSRAFYHQDLKYIQFANKEPSQC